MVKRGKIMATTVVALYDDRANAMRAVERLNDAGFDRQEISVMSQQPDETGMDVRYKEGNQAGEGAAAGAGLGAVLGGIAGLLIGLGTIMIPGLGVLLVAGPLAAALAGAGVGAGLGALIGALVGLGIPEEDAEYYAEGIRRGNTLVAVRTSDARVPDAVRILEELNPIDVERHAAEWRQEGWKPERTREHLEREPRFESGRVAEGEENIEVVEEDLRVGKREVERGGVRVRTHVVEEPVEEEVRLRDEEIRVERKPVDRPAREPDFRERTIEMTETDEEVVVGKEARVTEEVHVEKDVHTRPETVRDTVRRTKVEVEEIGERPAGYRGTDTAYTRYEPRFRQHWQREYREGDYTWDEYQHAYRYGYDLANTDGYTDCEWREVEPEAMRTWNRRNPGTWDTFGPAVREAWVMVCEERNRNV
jgi:uncharacterized protein (TIGR02271 family)